MQQVRAGASQLGAKYKYLQRKFYISGLVNTGKTDISLIYRILTKQKTTILGAFGTKYNYSVPKWDAPSKGNYDICVVFLEKGLKLLNKTGKLGHILPHKFFNAQYGEPVRNIISTGKNLSEIVHFGDQQVFSGPTTYTCLIFLDKDKNDFCKFTKVSKLSEWILQEINKDSNDTQTFVATANIKAEQWNFLPIKTSEIFAKLNDASTKLGDLASIFVGLQTSADKIYILEEIASPSQNMVKVKDANGNEWELERQIVKPFLSKYTVSSFDRPKPHHWLLFPYKLDDGKAIRKSLFRYPINFFAASLIVSFTSSLIIFSFNLSYHFFSIVLFFSATPLRHFLNRQSAHLQCDRPFPKSTSDRPHLHKT